VVLLHGMAWRGEIFPDGGRFFFRAVICFDFEGQEKIEISISGRERD
jgi:hypothetical protein